MEQNLPEHRHSVSVIIDDPAVRDSVRTLLESYGFAVTEYGSATSYLRKSGDSCVLLVDFALSGLNGLELVEILRSGGIDTPAIFMIDVMAPAQELRMEAVPGCARLNKPVRPAALLQLIEMSCNGTCHSSHM